MALLQNLQKKHSEGPTAANGGLLGNFELQDLRPLFASSIKKLKVGEYTDIVNTEEGQYIFKLAALTSVANKEYAEVEQEIHRVLYGEAVDRAFKLWVEEAKVNGFIDVRIKDAPTL